MTKTDWTAEEVRNQALLCAMSFPTIASMLDAFAERIEADESAAQHASIREGFEKWAVGEELTISRDEIFGIYTDFATEFRWVAWLKGALSRRPAQPAQVEPDASRDAEHAAAYGWHVDRDALKGVIAFACDEEVQGEECCKKWCGNESRCAVTFGSSEPPAEPARVDIPDWRAAMFDRWREAAQEKGYAGIAEAINAVSHAKQPAQEQPGWKMPDDLKPLADEMEACWICASIGEGEITLETINSWSGRLAAMLAASPTPPKEN
jgi:hypothetical protein